MTGHVLSETTETHGECKLLVKLHQYFIGVKLTGWSSYIYIWHICIHINAGVKFRELCSSHKREERQQIINTTFEKVGEWVSRHHYGCEQVIQNSDYCMTLLTMGMHSKEQKVNDSLKHPHKQQLK